jgi:hypothetical protein
LGHVRRLAALLTIGAAAAIAGCGGSGSSAAGGGAPSVVSSSCAESSSSAAGGAASPAQGDCTFFVSDGRRFRCSRGRYSLSPGSPTVAQLRAARGCAALSRLRLSPGTRTVIARVGRVRSCLQGRHLRVLGGPIIDPTVRSHGVLGELIAGYVNHGAVLAFYATSAGARAAQADATAATARENGRTHPIGSVLVIWIHTPAAAVSSVQGCARA